MDLMTIFYSRATGIIRRTEIGQFDMTIYGDAKEDMHLIYDYMVTVVNHDIINNPKSYRVDVNTKIVNRVIDEDSKKEFAEIKHVQEALYGMQETIKETLNEAMGELTIFMMDMFAMYHPPEPIPEPETPEEPPVE